jgi:hypothetical protein
VLSRAHTLRQKNEMGYIAARKLIVDAFSGVDNPFIRDEPMQKKELSFEDVIRDTMPEVVKGYQPQRRRPQSVSEPQYIPSHFSDGGGIGPYHAYEYPSALVPLSLRDVLNGNSIRRNETGS